MNLFQPVKEAWSGLPGIGKAGVGLVVGGGAFLIARKQIRNAQERALVKKQKKLFEQSQRKISVEDKDGNSVAVTINTATIAVKLHDLLYNNDPFGWTEDETAIVNTIRVIPKPYIPDIESRYQTLYKKNLRADIISALDEDEWQKVEHLFN